MLKKRIIPCLDVNQGRVVKGTRFKDLRDAGDPVEVAKRYDQQGAYVFVVDSEQKIKRTNITTGKQYPQKMEVLDGLKAGDSIIKKGLFGLRSGKKVNIIK